MTHPFIICIIQVTFVYNSQYLTSPVPVHNQARISPPSGPV